MWQYTRVEALAFGCRCDPACRWRDSRRSGACDRRRSARQSSPPLQTRSETPACAYVNLPAEGYCNQTHSHPVVFVTPGVKCAQMRYLIAAGFGVLTAIATAMLWIVVKFVLPIVVPLFLSDWLSDWRKTVQRQDCRRVHRVRVDPAGGVLGFVGGVVWMLWRQ